MPKGQLASRNRKPRICFVAHYAYGALAGIDSGHIGGIERQTSLMARWFAAHGYKVSMLTWDEGQEDGMEIDGIQVLKMCRRDAGMKGVRFFWPKWTSLCRAMKRANADIYYYNCGDLGLGQVVMWCRRHRRKAVYSVASDSSCDHKLLVLESLRERILYQYGLKNAVSVVVQTQRQQQMLHNGFGIDSNIIPMPSLGFGTNGQIHPKTSKEFSQVLWVGRISKEKRFEWLLDIAEKCPEITFDVVGAANADSEYASALEKRAAEICNVNMHGRVLYTEMAKYYKRCHVLCCTSAYEGFPNTFLEAWSCGIPVISTFDPDNVISSHGLGFAVQDVEELLVRLREIIQSPETWLRASKAAKQYYLTNHTPEACLPKYERMFLDVVGY